MKVVHISPTYFDETSFIGGGERYPTELATALAAWVPTTLVSFSKEQRSYRQGNLDIKIYPAQRLSPGGGQVEIPKLGYLKEVLAADAVHIHSIYSLVSDLAAIAASLSGKRVFVTDHGGGSAPILSHKLPVFRGYHHAIAQSQFTYDRLPVELQKKAIVLKGGVDTQRFSPDSRQSKEKKILFVGRILPHKGVNYLVEAFRLLARPDYRLAIVGRAYHQEFYQHLQQLAEGLPVDFIHDADDERLLQEYRTATVTVLPSVHTDCYGNYTPIPELMGFTLLESQACGTPVICSEAGAMAEFVDPGKTGFVVPENSAEAIASALQHFLDLSPTELVNYQVWCCQWMENFSWSSIAQELLKVYAKT
ncbi:glycosyltransferase family 4 protein [Kamptonema cortianum]|uniref:Glycosyltransferase family 4 protein n=1 Tax=Geitlerinema calcuttense NRMC-F 0142 TaxID=2922238 RepID=A0ABT7LYA3_9CYAN|nr:glycosyltransferase family 4 protein [Geitlerinema calcuttense]MDK3157455.1 glycosyltransferase family 4 protein [Kamptonema cortianum]MDL5056978.1 glycosyltransferase family 4 protein [Geitlerinema calcuttense NRMC-F 0142]